MKKITISDEDQNKISMLISGVSIGWLVGMSEAPVVQSTVSTILALVVGILSLAAGLKELPALWADKFPSATYFSRISLVPMALFLAGLSGGSAWGLYTRTNYLLGPNAPAIASRWAIDRADSMRIVSHMYALTFGDSANIKIAEGIGLGIGLHSGNETSLSECAEVRDRPIENIKDWLETNPALRSDSLSISRLDPHNVSDSTKLMQILETQCPESTK